MLVRQETSQLGSCHQIVEQTFNKVIVTQPSESLPSSVRSETNTPDEHQKSFDKIESKMQPKAPTAESKEQAIIQIEEDPKRSSFGSSSSSDRQIIN